MPRQIKSNVFFIVLWIAQNLYLDKQNVTYLIRYAGIRFRNVYLLLSFCCAEKLQKNDWDSVVLIDLRAHES